MQKIQQEFDKHFSKYKDHNIAIYGTGNNAKMLIESVKGYKFVNLVSKDFIGQVVYGKTVISLEEALKTADMMIIAATPSSTAIVYERIKELVPEHYPIYDMMGNRLEGLERYKNNAYWDCNLKQLQNAIKDHDVISFDIFDTLITRTALELKDVFDMVERQLKVEGITIPYVKWRVQAEEKCNNEYEAPTINQIYEVFKTENKISDSIVNRAQTLEFETDLQLLVKRSVMVETLEWAISIGKKVYFTSDMYYSKDEMMKILSNLGIKTNVSLLISSDIGKSKAKGSLFEHIVEQERNLSILHIGDNYEYDIITARKYGIDTFYIKKGYDMFAESSCGFLIDQLKTRDDRRLLGVIIAELCNNPLGLAESNGKLCINRYESLACILLPITILFMSEIVRVANRYDRLLFAARDGFFLNKLYSAIRDKLGDMLPRGEYFYASRSAMNSAATSCVEDIENYSRKLYEDTNTNIKDFMKLQFHIEVNDELDLAIDDGIKKWGERGLKDKLNKYNEEILLKSQANKNGYLRYISDMKLDEYEKMAIVDIVTQGTLVSGLSKLLNYQIELISLGTSWIPNRYIPDEKMVNSVYGNVYEKKDNIVYILSDLGELHLFLEMLYSSTEGQLYEFDENGNPTLKKDTEYDYELLTCTQNCILKMVESLGSDYYKMNVSKEFALACMRLFYRKNSKMSEELKDKFKFDDPYDVKLEKCNLIDAMSV